MDTKYPQLLKVIVLHVPIERAFEFARLMKANEFDWEEIYSVSKNMPAYIESLNANQV